MCGMYHVLANAVLVIWFKMASSQAGIKESLAFRKVTSIRGYAFLKTPQSSRERQMLHNTDELPKPTNLTIGYGSLLL